MTRDGFAAATAALVLGVGPLLQTQPYQYQPLPPEQPKVARNRSERRRKPGRRLR